MDVVFALDEKIHFLHLSEGRFSKPSENIALTITLGILATLLYTLSIIASFNTIRTIYLRCLLKFQTFDLVVHWVGLNVAYLTVSLMIYLLRSFDQCYQVSIAKRFEPLFNFNIVFLVGLLPLERFSKKVFSTPAFAGYVYLIVIWCIISVSIHDLSLVYQVGQVIMHILTVIIIIWKANEYRRIKDKSTLKCFYVFRIKIVMLYVLLWVIKNTMLFIVCYVLTINVTTILSICNIVITSITSMCLCYMVHRIGCSYKNYYDSNDCCLETFVEDNLTNGTEKTLSEEKV